MKKAPVESAKDPARASTRQEMLEGKDYLEDDTQTPGQGGASGGVLKRNIGSRDEMKRSMEQPPSASRTRKADTSPQERTTGARL